MVFSSKLKQPPLIFQFMTFVLAEFTVLITKYPRYPGLNIHDIRDQISTISGTKYRESAGLPTGCPAKLDSSKILEIICDSSKI